MSNNQLYLKYKKQYMDLKKSFNKSEDINKVIIIGGGCAGLTSALYCGRGNLKPLLFAGDLENKGGLLTKTSIVDNYPSYIDGILGYDLIQNMEEQAVKYGAIVIDKFILTIELKGKHFLLTDDTDTKYYTETIIIATGSKPNRLGLENEDNLWGKGISSCAVCDGALYKNKVIVVVGGGDSAIEEAQFLTKFSKVILIHRRDKFRASNIMQQKVLNNDKIDIIYDTEIIKLIGSDKLEGIIHKNVKTNEEKTIPVDGLFYGLGIKPNSLMFKDLLELDAEGYIVKKTDIINHYETATSIPGIFVAGDVSDKKYRQAIVACGDGCRAAMDVNDYLSYV